MLTDPTFEPTLVIEVLRQPDQGLSQALASLRGCGQIGGLGR